MNSTVMTNKDKAYQMIEEHLSAIQPKDLGRILWKSGWLHTQGWSKNDDTDLWDMVMEDELTISIYNEWRSYATSELLKSNDEYFEEEYGDANEDDRYYAADEWVDDDGWFYSALISYTTELLEEYSEQIEQELCEETIQKYQEVIDSIETSNEYSIQCETLYNYDDYGFKTEYGLQVYVLDKNEEEVSDIFMEHCEGKWTYWCHLTDTDYSSFDDVVEKLKMLKK